MKRNIALTALTAFAVSVLTMFGYVHFFMPDGETVRIEHVDATPSQPTLFTKNNAGNFEPLDFSAVAERVIDGVVHIRSTVPAQAGQYRQPQGQPFPFFDDDIFERFFGPQYRGQVPRQREMPPKVGSGSGVIIDESGYIVTNNHVVNGATDLEVTLNDNRSLKAELVGVDPTTDIAVLKIEAEQLTPLSFINSDEVNVGQWVLAIGNPFNLNSTVTAGIVSAKARNINILREQYAVESFIQTDAAINPGNSGGALVDLQGGLVGINTAIASPTGAYSGYGFAVPSNIVKKVVEDLIEYGSVQRGYLGVMIRDVNSQLAKERKLSVNAGVLVDSVMTKSAAGAAGVEPGDVVIAVDGQRIQQSNELQERVARKRPGDDVVLTLVRDGRERDVRVKLNGDTGSELAPVLAKLGIRADDLDASEIEALGIRQGVRVSEVLPGRIRRETGIREGFVITHLDREAVKDKAHLVDLLKRKSGGVMIEGIYPDRPGRHYYAFGLEG